MPRNPELTWHALTHCASQLEKATSSFVLSFLYLGTLDGSLEDEPVPLATQGTLPVRSLNSDFLFKQYRKGKHKTSTADQCTWWSPATGVVAKTDGFNS